MLQYWSAADHTNLAEFTLGVPDRVCLALMIRIVISLLCADIISNHGFAAIGAISLQRAFDNVRFAAGHAHIG